ncbi:MAG: hypothetical protein ACRDF4_06385 [Rhabdochlamydiaceae bacterium]
MDIFYKTPSGSLGNVQVKATTDSWIRIESIPEAEFTVLVDFNGWDLNKDTDFYVMKSEVAYDLAKKDKDLWLTQERSRGKNPNEASWPAAINLLKGEIWEELRPDLESAKGNWSILTT